VRELKNIYLWDDPMIVGTRIILPGPLEVQRKRYAGRSFLAEDEVRSGTERAGRRAKLK
jgi:hypothetical protein